MSIGKALRRAVTPPRQVRTALKRLTTAPAPSYKVNGYDYGTKERYDRLMKQEADRQKELERERSAEQAQAVVDAGGDPRIAERMEQEAEIARAERDAATLAASRAKRTTGNLRRLGIAEQIAEPITGSISARTKVQQSTDAAKTEAIEKQKTLEQERIQEARIQSLLDPVRTRRRKAATETADAMRAGRGRASLMQSQRGGIGFYSRLFNR